MCFSIGELCLGLNISEAIRTHHQLRRSNRHRFRRSNRHRFRRSNRHRFHRSNRRRFHRNNRRRFLRSNRRRFHRNSLHNIQMWFKKRRKREEKNEKTIRRPFTKASEDTRFGLGN